MKNVALFSSAFYPHMGGVEELVRQLAHAYRRRGMSPIVLTNRWPLSLPAYECYEDIPVYRLALRVPDGNVKARIRYSLSGGRVRREMLDILRRHRIDCIHVHCVSANGFYALQARRALKLPLVVTTQGERTIDATQLYQRSAFMNRVLRQLLSEADFVTGCSRHTLEDLEQYWGRPFGDRARVIYNGVNLDDFEAVAPFPHPRPYVLGIGRLVPNKGFDVLIRAFAKARMPSHDLLVAGEGVERGPLERLAGDLGLQDKVRFLGRVDRPTAVALFLGCSFFVLPSRDEPQGIVNLEAMAAGKAIIATRVGGVPEMVTDGENGLLMPADDPDALASALERLGGDEGLRQRLSDAGLRRVQDFRWPAIAEEYVQIYNAIGTRRP
ncbi:MAG: glycosyltransferase family 4 protein [Armatimonadetes bacterium]|nr:glycosyltransferase family 4 protein [Armatimonadota bacterium]